MTEAAGRATLREYLELEARSATKHEYVGGVIVAMAGASPRHNLIAANLVRRLSELLEGGPCRVFTSDQRVRIPETGAHVYPDVTVVCDEPAFDDGRPPSLQNPVVIVEVLSPSTAEYDRGAKLAHYRRLSTVRHILLVEPNEARVEHYRRLEEGEWRLTDVLQGVIEIGALSAQLTVDHIYAKVEGLPLDRD